MNELDSNMNAETDDLGDHINWDEIPEEENTTKFIDVKPDKGWSSKNKTKNGKINATHVIKNRKQQYRPKQQQRQKNAVNQNLAINETHKFSKTTENDTHQEKTILHEMNDTDNKQKPKINPWKSQERTQITLDTSGNTVNKHISQKTANR